MIRELRNIFRSVWLSAFRNAECLQHERHLIDNDVVIIQPQGLAERIEAERYVVRSSINLTIRLQEVKPCDAITVSCLICVLVRPEVEGSSVR